MLIGCEVYSIVTLNHSRKTNSMAKMTTCASAVVTKIITSLAVKGALATGHNFFN